MKVHLQSTTHRSNGGSADYRVQLQSDQEATPNQFLLCAFPTSLGWMGLLGEDEKLVSVYVGHSSSKTILRAASKMGTVIDDCDWNPSLRGLLEAYTEGEMVDFSEVELQLPSMTPFRHQTIMATRQLAYGQTTSYGELAERIGHPRAVCAVGTVMSTNRFPIVVPCHRVLASGGKLGGYTSPSGTGLKQKLLEIESRSSG